MAITLLEHRNAITKRIIALFSDSQRPKKGLATWFPTETSQSKSVGIEVERNRQLVAVDVQRGTQGNLNTFESFTEKLYVPPFFNEKFNLVGAQNYEVTFGNATNPTREQAMIMLQDSNRKLQILKDKIERAYELQRSQALQTGIVTMKNGDNIDFKRKAESITVLTGADVWTDAAADPSTELKKGCDFLRNEGLSGSSEVDVIFGSSAFTVFMNNEKVKEKFNYRRVDRISLTMPRTNSEGLALHGQISVGDFIVNIWTYNAVMENPDGSKTPYIDPKNIVMLPQDFEGIQAFGALPDLPRDAGNAEFPNFIRQVEADYHVNNYIDPAVKAHIFEIYSAGVAVPVSIDRVYTSKVIA